MSSSPRTKGGIVVPRRLPTFSSQSSRELPWVAAATPSGTANLFVMVEPLAGWRHVAVTERRTKRDYAECLRWLMEEHYPKAKYICVVQDKLNTHISGALYEA